MHSWVGPYWVAVVAIIGPVGVAGGEMGACLAQQVSYPRVLRVGIVAYGVAAVA